MKSLIFLLAASFSSLVHAADLNQEMDALGANKKLMLKAESIDPKNKLRVVQKREVDRYNRLEFSVNYGTNASGGDAYVNTSMLGGQMDFHFTPRWSVGARYTAYNNSLNSQGQRAMDEYESNAAAGKGAARPDIAWPHNSWLGVIDFYPTYGKLDLFDSSVTQFDVYVLAGAGQINLETGPTPLYTAGGGLGIWWSQHVTTRLEARWQGYTDKVYGSSRNQNETVLSASMGFIL